MDFPINGKAEGRILIPWEHKEFPEMSVQDSSGELLQTALVIESNDILVSGNQRGLGRQLHCRLARRRKCLGVLAAHLSTLLQSAPEIRIRKTYQPRSATRDESA